MKHWISKAGLALGLALAAITTTKAQYKSPQPLDTYFPKKDLMPVGAYYYPEAWHHSRWERDIKKMAELGFEFTHFGEFAWGYMEPEEGKYNFGWLDTAVALAGKYGLKVILCTPTPCPPAWMTHKYPDITSVDENGTQMRHGGRLHPSWSNKRFLGFTEKIVTELAKRYANNPHVWGWQLDNEPSKGGIHYDYSPAAQESFRNWLRKRYSNNIALLNNAWGGGFWSFRYTDFEQIRIPNAKETPAGISPHARLEFQRFQSEELGNFLGMQTNILRKYISPKQFVTTNFAYHAFLPEINLFDSRNSIDFSSYTMYLLSTYLGTDKGPLAHRLGSGLQLSFTGELAKSTHGITGCMELQPGQINWGAWNSQPLPGAVRMWVWHAFAFGSRFTCTYRFDRPIYGGEQYHGAIMDPDGVTVSMGGKEFVQATKEIAGLRKLYDPKVAEPEVVKKRRVALLWEQQNLWNTLEQAQTNQWNTWNHIYTWYGAAKRSGSPVTFLTEKDKIDPKEHPTAIAMAYQLIDPQVVKKWTDYAEAGGNLIITCRSGHKDKNGHLWEGPWVGPMKKLIGADVAFYDHLPEGTKGSLSFGGQNFQWNNWADIMAIDAKGVETWGQYTDQFYNGKSGIIHRKLGKGTVTYVGVDTDEGELELQVLRKVFDLQKASYEKLPPYVFKEWRDGFWVATNYSSEVVDLALPSQVKPLFGNSQLAPGGVTVWK